MAKYFIFDNSSKGLAALADTDEKKNNFLYLQTIYTAVQANDEDYLNVKKGLKKTTLSNDNTALTENITANDFGYLDTDNLDDAKNTIKKFIEIEIKHWKLSNHSNNNSMIEALNQIDVNALSSVPTGAIGEWIFSQPRVPLNRPFEL